MTPNPKPSSLRGLPAATGRSSLRGLLAIAAALAAVLAAGPVAAAAEPPAVSAAAARQVTATSAVLRGTVDPNGQRTTAYVEYGTTRRYGSRTPDQDVGAGRRARRIVAPVSGLAPDTTYHFRVVAANATGVRSSGDRTFRTRREPLALGLGASPDPVRFGDGVTLAGRLTGTGNAGRQVVLEGRGFPYTSSFAPVGNPVVTDAGGAFAFTLLTLPVTTQFRAVTGGRPRVASPIVTAAVAVRVGTRVSARRVRRGRRVRFSGTVRPARDGAQFAIQKRKRTGEWVVVAGGITRHRDESSSRFSRRVRVRRGGRYRVYVRVADGSYVPGIGREIRIRTRR